MRRKIKLLKSNNRLKNEYQELLKFTESLELAFRRYKSYVKLCVIRNETPDPDATSKDIKTLFIKHCARKEENENKTI